MAKQVLNTGVFRHGNIGYGLIDAKVTESPTKIDSSDTYNNNEIMIGRDSWQFTATVIKDDNKSIIPDTSATTIVIELGRDAWIGTAYVLTVEIVGRIDDKVVLNVSGEFLPTAYHIRNLFNGASWYDGNNDGYPDDITSAWNNTPSYNTDPVYGLNLRYSSVTTADYLRKLATINIGTNYLWCVCHDNNISQLSVSLDSGTGTPLTVPSVTTITEYGVITSNSGDDRAELDFNSPGSGYLYLYYLACGKIINQLS